MLDAQLQESQMAAQALYAQGDYASAVVKFRDIVQAHPTSDDALRGLGFALVAAGDPVPAIDAFRRAIQINLDHAESHFGLGLALSAAGDDSRAVHAFDEALKHRTNHVAARRALIGSLLKCGQKALADGNMATAEQVLERANKLDKVSPDTVTHLYDYYLRTGAHVKAVKLIEAARAGNPDSPQIKAIADAIAQNSQLEHAKTVVQLRDDGPSKATTPAPRQFPCPNCHQSVMEWASICPYCSFEIKAKSQSSRFAAIDPGPRYTWQEIAYYVLAGLWIIQGAISLVVGFLLSGKSGDDPSRTYSGLIGGFNVAVGLGLIFQVSWMQWLAYLMCLLNLFMSGMGLMIGLGLGNWGVIIYQVVMLSIVGFQVYLLRYMGDV